MPEKKHPSNARKLAELLDSRFTVPGTSIKIGIDPILGVLIGLGDWATAILSVYLMFYATKLCAKASVLLRMFMNIFIDLLIGTIPILGDLFDVAWKANIRNVRLLEKLEAAPLPYQIPKLNNNMGTIFLSDFNPDRHPFSDRMDDHGDLGTYFLICSSVSRSEKN